jgi:RNA polymerase sigma factor (sigma-70 family)
VSSLQLHRLVDHLSGLADRPSDDHLLAAFVRGRDEAAFAELVRRHGPMVLAACRRATGREQDAEDAFQATFLVLARKASGVRPRSAVGAWLHGVAVRTALKARTRSARFVARQEVPAVAAPVNDSPDADACRILDEEIDRLSEPLRLAVVLCELQGVPRREAAARLGVREGTLSSRLATARKRLAERLKARGVTLGVGGVAALLTGSGELAPLGAALLDAGSRVAVGPAPAPILLLSDGVVKAMFMKKLKAVAVGLLVIGAVGGGWGTAVQLGGSPGSVARAADAPPAAKPDPAGKDPAREAFEKLVAANGDWKREKPALDELKALGAKAKDLLQREAEHHEKERVRDYCYELLTGQFPKDERVIRTVLVHGLSDKSERIRYRLAFWVGEQKVYDAHRRLRHMMVDKANDERTKLAAAKSLAQLGEGDVLRPLYYGLESDWYMERMMANAGIKALAGKDLNDFGGYDWREGAFVSGGVEGVGPFDPIHRAEKRLKRYTAIKAYFEWLKEKRPDLYKHLTGAF